ncbi:MAG: hypothetical protein ACRCZI_10495 [Cetobacterium sp.]
MSDFYYLDRPSVPPTQQVLINLDSITDISVLLKSEEIIDNLMCEAAEVRNVDGEIEGTLVYIGGMSLTEIISPPTSVESDVAGLDEFPVDLSEDTDAITEGAFNAESRSSELDLLLAEAKKNVLDLQQEITDEEGALD